MKPSSTSLRAALGSSASLLRTVATTSSSHSSRMSRGHEAQALGPEDARHERAFLHQEILLGGRDEIHLVPVRVDALGEDLLTLPHARPLLGLVEDEVALVAAVRLEVDRRDVELALVVVLVRDAGGLRDVARDPDRVFGEAYAEPLDDAGRPRSERPGFAPLRGIE